MSTEQTSTLPEVSPVDSWGVDPWGVDPWGADVDVVFQLLVAELTAQNPFQDGVRRLVSIQQEEAALHAEKAAILMELVQLTQNDATTRDVGGSGAEMALELAMRSVAVETGIALRVSDRTMQARLSEAWDLMERFPATMYALQCGRVSIAHARVIMDESGCISDPAARIDYEVALLERAESITPGRLRKLAQRAAATLGEGTFEARHAEARAERSVRRTDTADGMSEVVATIPTVLAAGVMDRLTAMANAVKAADRDDTRTLDQIRADLLCELQLSGDPTGEVHAAAAGIRADVSIQVPVMALLGCSDDPATVLGGGPIGMDEAAILAAGAPSLIRMLTDPITEQLLAVDTYRPSEQLRRFLRLRDGRCRCPSCNRAAWRCDIDHTIPYSEGGPTVASNLAALCPGHHTIKHLPGWTVKQVTPGVLEWRTPHGIVAIDRPDTPVRFEER